MHATYILTVITMGAGIVATFGSQWLIANTLDVLVYGEFITNLTYAGLFCVFYSLGLGMGQSRFVPRYLNVDSALLKGYGSLSIIIMLLMTIVIVVVLNILKAIDSSYYLVCYLIPPLGIFTFLNNSFKCDYRPNVANLFEPTLKNLSFAVSLLLFGQFYNDITLDNVIFLFMAVILGLSIIQLRYTWVPWTKWKTKPEYEVKNWISVSLPMTLVAMSYLLAQSIDILLIGALDLKENVAIYFIGLKLASILFLCSNAVKLVLSPYISKAYHCGKLSEMVFDIRKVSLILSLICVLIIIFLFIFGKNILQLYGAEYTQAYAAMLILSIGYLLVISFGPSDTLLMVTNFERSTLAVYASAAVINFVLNYILIPFYSINGAALATSVTFVGQAAFMFMLTRKKLGINVSIFTKHRRVI